MSTGMSSGILDRVRATGLLDLNSVIVGLSGGVDSVVLAHLFSQNADLDLHLAHVNYGLRGLASDKDQALCENLAEELNCRLHVLNAKDKSPETGIQEWARNLRYSFFTDLGAKLEIETVAVAHHRDDQVETILHNLFRGTGITGLVGMKARRDHEGSLEIIRPLLEMSRDEITKYAKEASLSWREDQSNTDEKYTRAWIRAVLVPMLESKYGSGLKKRISNTSRDLSDIKMELLEPELIRLKDLAVKKDENDSRFRVSIKDIEGTSPVVQKQLLLSLVRELNLELPLSSAFAERLFELLSSQKGKRLRVGKFLATREKDQVYLGKDHEVGSDERFLGDDLHVEKDLDIGSAILKLRVVNASALDFGKNDGREHVDFGKIKLPLSVRPWKNGDRFKPLGMQGHKLLSDFLTDKNVENWKREEQVVVLSDETIIWVPGYGISDDFKLDSDSDLALELLNLIK